MKVTALAGGVGAARFLSGLAAEVRAEDITAIVNTGDDFRWMGLQICPDLDIVLYTLAGQANPATGWGVLGDTFACLDRLSLLGMPDWFRVGDRDLATHIARTVWLSQGEPLSAVTSRLCAREGVACTLLPMSDDAVPTLVHSAGGDLTFQDYFVRLQCQPVVKAFTYLRAAETAPAPGVLEAIEGADAVIVCPSNPLISIGPILAVAGVREALRAVRGRVVGISPVIEGRAVKGPTVDLLRQLGHEPSAAGVAKLYSDFMGSIVIDEADWSLAPRIVSLGMETHLAPTLMDSADARRRLAARVLAAAGCRT